MFAAFQVREGTRNSIETNFPLHSLLGELPITTCQVSVGGEHLRLILPTPLGKMRRSGPMQITWLQQSLSRESMTCWHWQRRNLRLSCAQKRSGGVVTA